MEIRVLGKFVPFGEQHIKSKDITETSSQKLYNQSHDFFQKCETNDSFVGTSNSNYILYEGFDPSTKNSNESKNVDEELFIKNNTVVWSRCNVLQKSFKFDEPVLQALFVWFNAKKASMNSNEMHDSKITNRLERQRALFVLFQDYARVYFLDGQHFLIRLPSPVRHAWAMNCGVILQCTVDEKKSSLNNFPSGSLPMLYSLLDPLEEIKSVSIADKIMLDELKVNIKGKTQRNNSMKKFENQNFASSSSPRPMRSRSSSNVRADTLQNFDGRKSIEDSFQNVDGRNSLNSLQSLDRFLYYDHDEMLNELRIKSDSKSEVFLELIWTESIAKIEKLEKSDVFIVHDYVGNEILSTRLQFYDILFFKEVTKLELWIGYGNPIPLNYDIEMIKSEFDFEDNKEWENKSIPRETLQLQYRKYLTSKQSHHQFSSDTVITELRDWVHNRTNLVFFNNKIVRISLNFIPSSKLVRSCLEALSFALPTNLFFEFKAEYMLFQYGTEKEDSKIQRETEWESFIIVLLSFFQLNERKLSGKETEETKESDWDFLIASSKHSKFNFDNHFLCLRPSITKENYTMINLLEKSQILRKKNYDHRKRLEENLSSFLPSILFSLHLIYQDLRLNVLSQKFVNDIIPLLLQLAIFLDLDIYVDYYQQNYGLHQKLKIKKVHIMKLNLNNDHPFFMPPDIFKWILKCLRYGIEKNENFPSIKSIGPTFSIPNIQENLIHEFECSRIQKINSIYKKLVTEGEKSMILEIVNVGYFIKDIDSLPFGIVVPLREAIRKCREKPPANWPGEAYILIGREDLAELSYGVPIGYIHTRGNKMEPKPQKVQRLLKSCDVVKTDFPNPDLRFVFEFKEFLKIIEKSSLINFGYVKKKSSNQNEEIPPQVLERVQAQCLKNFSQPVGRGILTYGTATPIVTEPFPIPGISLTIKVLPINILVQIDRAIRFPESIEWPEFHDGVAAGLRIPSTFTIEGSWISLNKPKELNNSHAGFLLGLGLNGHLKSMATWQAVDYLMKTPKHDITTIALVLGLTASYIGTMNNEITKFVAVHVTAMFPPKSTSLNVSPLVQTASILGCGLLYMETCNRYMSQIMLAEISTKALKTPDNFETDFTEGYSLAAGLALGFINLGKGDNALESLDLDLFKELRTYINGGKGFTKKSTIISSGGGGSGYNTNENNVNITSPGATIALGLLYLKTNKINIANKIPIPETEFYLDYVRPDFLLIRILAKNLIMWDNIQSSTSWVKSHVPQYMNTKLELRRRIDCENLESIKRAYYFILAGACFSMSLKFAGSSDKNALKCLLYYLDFFMKLESERTLATFDSNITLSAIRICLNVLVVSTSIVAAGSGNLEVMRRIRKLHKKDVDISNSNSYGSHMITSMALGFLCLGGGNYTLSTSNKAIAGLVSSLFPRYPIEPYDNRAYLQAFRHLWVLAVEKRCLILRDIETREACHVPVKITFKDLYNTEIVTRADGVKEFHVDSKTKESVAPCLLPESEFIQKIEIDSPRYWSIQLEFGKNSEYDHRFWNNPTLYVKRKTGHLTYAEDPQGLRDLFARIFPDGKSLLGSKDSLLKNQQKLDFIRIFSSDPQVQAFSRYLCEDFKINVDDVGIDLSTFCNSILSECLNADKVEAIQIYLELYQIQRNLEKM
ncbi:1562_t:CDS:10 [Diversispora eburnea]|uniref:1562_t:CDS:1 n=1 Tax=Diversispora eburnea TaxID=1213867 RepID=A0A9N8V0Z6_9GLOM|nr:1562_t:CDS:10 [Diversispora eburnea]